jgi:hypothetical protein
MEDRPLQAVKLTIPDARIKTPVLINPLTATVHRLPRASHVGGQWRIEQAPLADHPLLVADKESLEIAPLVQ